MTARRLVAIVVTLVLVGLVVCLIAVVAVVHRLNNAGPKVSAPHETLPPSGAPLNDNSLVMSSDRTGNYEVYVTTTSGGPSKQLTGDKHFDSWWAKVSPDRARILFYRTPKGVHDHDFTKTALWVMNADGSQQLELRPVGTDGWKFQGHAEWSPSGKELVMFGGSRLSPQIWITTASGRSPRQVTKRGGANLDPSWSPDGSKVAFVGCPGSVCFQKDYEVYVVPAAGGASQRITDNKVTDNDPYFSPDGKRLAWLSRTKEDPQPGVWNIHASDASGANQHSITDDGNINSKPQWSRDGSHIYFHRMDRAAKTPKFDIFQIKPDGTDMAPVTPGQPGSNEYPSV